MNNIKKIFFSLITFILGWGLGVSTLYLLPGLALSPDNPLYRKLDITKPYIFGFLPYFLLDRADKNYLPYLTNLAYFALTVNSDGSIKYLDQPGEEEPGWNKLKNRIQPILDKSLKNNVKTSLVIHLSDETVIENIINNATESAQNLIADLNPLIIKYKFSDLNLDIESFREASASDQLLFTAFVSEVKNGLTEINKSLTLSLDLSPSALFKPFIYNISQLGRIINFVILMGYDYHYSGSFHAGPVAPVGGTPEIREHDIQTALNLITKIIPSHKIILAVPLYGYQWETLTDSTNAPVIPGSSSTASNRRIEQLLTTCNKCTQLFNSESLEPYVIFPSDDRLFFNQIYYENNQSLEQKLVLAKNYNLGGVALWALGYEGDTMLDPLAEFKLQNLNNQLN